MEPKGKKQRADNNYKPRKHRGPVLLEEEEDDFEDVNEDAAPTTASDSYIRWYQLTQ
jgi:hypothetical protein